MNVQDAKTHLSRLLSEVERGEEVVIARGGRPVARLSLITEKPQRELGFLAGVVRPPSDAAFFEPLPEDELAAFEGALDGGHAR